MSTINFLILIAFNLSMFVDQHRILSETNGGLDIILRYYPQAGECINNGKKFKLREQEKTASATLKRLSDGAYVVTDFGGDQKPRNAILTCMLEENIDFKSACQILGERFNILPNELKPEIHKPQIESRDAQPDENEKEWYFEVRDEFTELDIRTVLADKAIPHIKSESGASEIDMDKIAKVFKRYHFYSLKSYSIVKNRKVITISATDHYPMMMWDEGTFKKIYQPLSPDKSRRFMYYGKRDKDYLHGLDVANKVYVDTCEPKESDSEADTESRPNKLEEIILCSGGSDGMNLAMFGYQVVWGNSETSSLTEKQFKKLSKIAEKVMNVPDIDATGLREAHQLAMRHLELYTINLPVSLRERSDKRGNPCKDLKDFFKYYNGHDFQTLLAIALPYQFWSTEYQKTRNGSYRPNYTVRNTRMYNFLEKNGFSRFELYDEKSGYIYIQIENNVVREVKSNEVKNYINKFFEDRNLEEDLRDAFYRSTQLGETSLSNLQLQDIDFTDYTKSSQYFFFKNQTVQADAQHISAFKPGEIDRYVWDDEVIDHNFKLQKDHFKITEDDSGVLDIEVLKTDNVFFNFLINTSRMFWRKELEDLMEDKSPEYINEYNQKNKFNIAGPHLNEQEILEQKGHLINKIYTLGYLLHRYKDPSRPWAVFAMDHRISDDGESHGGSGKSIVYKSVRHFMKSVTLDGRKPKLTEDQFIYENVTRHTGYILVDDGNQYLNFHFFFAPLTGDLTVNPKNNRRFILPFKDVPKFTITSNFVIRDLDSSTLRRLLYSVFSDYYHQKSNDYYKESRGPKDDFGKNILNEDFTEEEWNDFYNFMIQCCKFYLNHSKIDPPMENVEKRNLLSVMGTVFHEWADVYFSEDSGNLDKMVVKLYAFEDFKRYSRSNWTSQKFTKALRAWARYYRYELNPYVYLNTQGRIIQKIDQDDGEKKSMEMVYIQTTKDLPQQELDLEDF